MAAALQCKQAAHALGARAVALPESGEHLPWQRPRRVNLVHVRTNLSGGSRDRPASGTPNRAPRRRRRKRAESGARRGGSRCRRRWRTLVVRSGARAHLVVPVHLVLAKVLAVDEAKRICRVVHVLAHHHQPSDVLPLACFTHSLSTAQLCDDAKEPREVYDGAAHRGRLVRNAHLGATPTPTVVTLQECVVVFLERRSTVCVVQAPLQLR
mmetsp:Transcript_6933/g.17925  ORF Transcript_6933/g.17925 Transcript_6933/m.17925 type:complete len:211 (+) Transcript_6933:1347-1979(+)